VKEVFPDATPQPDDEEADGSSESLGQVQAQRKWHVERGRHRKRTVSETDHNAAHLSRFHVTPSRVSEVILKLVL